MKAKLQIYKRSSDKYYYLRIVTEKNNKKKIKIICCNSKNKKVALNFLKDYKDVLMAKNNDLEKKISDIKPVIINYTESNLSNASYKKYELTLRKMIDIIGDKPINSITMEDVEMFKLNLSSKVRKVTVNSYLRNLKAIWNLLYKMDLASKQNLIIKEYKIPEQEIISFTETEMDLIINKISHSDIKTIVKLAKETGLRISELLNLKTKNIDLENRFIKVNNTEDFKTKSGKNRLIPFNDRIELLINSVLKTDKESYLFTSKWNIPYKRNHVTRYFRRTLDELSFDKRYHFHCLRATFIMNLVRKGINPIIIQKLAGHSTLTVTQKYCFVQINDLRQALNT